MDQSEMNDNLPSGAVAIIGMVGRFPGANDLETYWRNIRDGVETVTHFTEERLLAAGISPGIVQHPAYVKARGIVDDIDKFDPAFFGYSARDAVVMDPQQRMFLQCAWEALENAGYDPRAYQGLIGVYGGCTASSYQNFVWNNLEAIGADVLSVAIGNELPFLTTRVSYKLDLKGPSCPVQTACSTSLVAVHLACQGLLNAECDIALAGGVSLRLPQDYGYFYQEEGILSPDGRCRPFDAKAAGTLFSNGIGMVVLKRLDDAIADRDTIYAIVRGSAINNDGARKASFTAPGVVGQSQVVADALASAQVEPESISLHRNARHGHGARRLHRNPGADQGVSVRASAATAPWDRSRPTSGISTPRPASPASSRPCSRMRHKQLPPMVALRSAESRHQLRRDALLRQPPAARLARVRAGCRAARVSARSVSAAPTRTWCSKKRPRRLRRVRRARGRSSRSRPRRPRRSTERRRISPNSSAAIRRSISRMPPTHSRSDGARSASAGSWWQGLAGDAARALDTRDQRIVFDGSHDGPSRPVVFLFPGQGSQFAGMGREVYAQEPAFREAVDECASHIDARTSASISASCCIHRARPTRRVSTRTSIAQPALFVVEYALSRLWMSWGIAPAAFIGHSVGEWVAACLSGVVSLDDALRLVALRGRLMEQMPEGVMAALPLPESMVQRLLNDQLWLAAVNHPNLTVVSGTSAAIDALETRMRADGIEIQRLHTSHAFHSGLMDGAIKPFVDAVAAVSLQAPSTPFISNVSGTWITAEEACDPAYWGRQIRQPVRFAAGVAELLKDDTRLFLEVGPGNTLSTLVRRQAGPRVSPGVISSLRHAREEGSDVATVVTALGRLWANGGFADWASFHGTEDRVRIALPPYVFDKQRYWVDPPAAAAAAKETAKHRSANTRLPIEDWFYVPGWKRQPAILPAGLDHLVDQRCWLVIADEGRFASRIVERLEASGATVVSVSAGSQFRRLEAGRYSVSPASRADYELLLKELLDIGHAPSTVLHVSSVDIADSASWSLQGVEEDQARGFDSLLALAQAFGEAALPSPVRIGFVTSQANDVTGEENIAPGRSIAFGLCHVIPQEYPHLSCKIIDLASSDSTSVLDPTDASLDRLLADVVSDQPDRVIAYRAAHRWVQTFTPMAIRKPAGLPARLRPNGVYLISGGIGEIGLNIASYLIDAVKARVVLTGRSGMPARDQWDEYLSSHADHDLTTQRIRRIRDLEARGGEVLVIKADAADPAQTRAAFEAAEERFGAVHGVIHAAGLILGDAFRPISETDADICRRQFQPKIAGLQVLDQLIEGRNLDFCLLVSSLSSILGGLRYAAYASANAFMDAFAHGRNRTSRFPWLTVNWDAWLRTEDEERMKASKSPVAGFAMTGAEGVEAFHRLLSIDAGVQVVVSTGDLRARIEQWVSLDALKKADARPTMRHPRPNLQTEFVAPRSDLETSIAGIWQELLGIEAVGVNDNFFELGGDSFLGIQLISKLKSELGVKVSAVTLYEGPRVSLMAEIVGARSNGGGEAAVVDSSRRRGEKRRERKLRQGADAQAGESEEAITEPLGA